MKKNEQNRTTYTVGFVHGAVYEAGDEVKRGEVRDGVDVNKAAIFQATNRGVILGTSKDKKEDIAGAVKDFEAQVAKENKELQQHADAQVAAGANLAAMVKGLQAELATLRKQIA